MAEVGSALVLAVFVGCFMVPACGVLAWCWSYHCTDDFTGRAHGMPSGFPEYREPSPGMRLACRGVTAGTVVVATECVRLPNATAVQIGAPAQP